MNILILVGSFLLIFSFGIATFIKHSASGILKQTYFSSVMEVERDLHNRAQATQYQRAITRERKPKEEKKPRAPRAKKFSRDKAAPNEKSKFNLIPLFTPSAEHDQLYEIAAKLLKDIYGDTGISKAASQLSVSNFEYKILDALIAKAHTEKEFVSLEDLAPEEHNLRELFLKMMHGTKHYTLATKQGYPPLGDFFLLHNKRKAICFCFASTPLLNATFGTKITQYILEEEGIKAQAKKSPALKMRELEELLNKQGDAKTKLVTMRPLMDFDRKAIGDQNISMTDRNTKIRHKICLPEKKQ